MGRETWLQDEVGAASLRSLLCTGKWQRRAQRSDAQQGRVAIAWMGVVGGEVAPCMRRINIRSFSTPGPHGLASVVTEKPRPAKPFSAAPSLRVRTSSMMDPRWMRSVRAWGLEREWILRCIGP